MDLTRTLENHSRNAHKDSNAFKLEDSESQVHTTNVLKILNGYGSTDQTASSTIDDIGLYESTITWKPLSSHHNN